MQAHQGIMTWNDLKNYRSVLREPLQGSYRGYQIITMPPPSSGGIALLEMLNILENFDMRAIGYNSSQKYHLLIEAMRRAFADRSEYLGDPDFVRVPSKALTSKRYAAELAKSISLDKATISTMIKPGKLASYESDSTTHFTIVDKAGNVVSNTYTLNGSYGSGATVRGTGILLNNEMDDFAAKPGLPNDYGLIQGESNAVAANKRPLSSMTPTIVLKDDKFLFAIGSPGGPTIINTVLQVIINVIDYDMNIQQAVDAPRIHHQWLPDLVTYEPYGMAQDTVKILKALGHQFREQPGFMGSAQGVMIEAETGRRLGGSDSRAPDGKAVGY
jgi:gamma-glutamyltranspeptidase/glutathione hydrolase